MELASRIDPAPVTLIATLGPAVLNSLLPVTWPPEERVRTALPDTPNSTLPLDHDDPAPVTVTVPDEPASRPTCERPLTAACAPPDTLSVPVPELPTRNCPIMSDVTRVTLNEPAPTLSVPVDPAALPIVAVPALKSLSVVLSLAICP